MSYFQGCHNLVMLIFFIVIIRTSMADVGNPLSFELSSREELVQLAGYGEEKLSTVLVSGTLLCEACLHGHPHLQAWPISGALVGVHCHARGRRKSSCLQGVTDEYGDFLIDLPSHLHAIPNLDKTCSVTVLRLPHNSQCRSAYVKKRKGLRLSSFGNGIRTYTAGRLRLHHSTSKPSHACIKNESSDQHMEW
ncbi:Pollen_Ole_e_I domain-containing protein [Cephalotus follicularis]|uniref:Pollen_Ole_e_I domain-containing protein n=1 Tax=Cephalotus follicularis TaxID=3775 RepID=A0A1Q3AWC4_CEPFO|nr:Pollen_Ole_e_I domain-containing protein [Cephalotus follicularis]